MSAAVADDGRRDLEGEAMAMGADLCKYPFQMFLKKNTLNRIAINNRDPIQEVL
jgi:hypothetical protein